MFFHIISDLPGNIIKCQWISGKPADKNCNYSLFNSFSMFGVQTPGTAQSHKY